MATLESLSKRSIQAIGTIESKLRELGVEMTPLPRTHRDRDILRSLQLEAIANALSQIEPDNNQLKDKTKAELQVIADEKNLAVQGTGAQDKITKGDLLAAIQGYREEN